MASTDVATREEDNAAVATRERPLNQSQLRTLERLVVGDFDDLLRRVLAEIDTKKAQRFREIDQEFGDESKLAAANQQLRDMQRRFEDQATVLQEKLAGKGIKIKNGYTFYKATVGNECLAIMGHDEATQRAVNAALRLGNVARNTIEKHKRMATRLVLLQGLTGQAAAELLNDMPGSEDVLAQVYEQFTGEAAAEVAELIGGE